jgi:hypothetical protein
MFLDDVTIGTGVWQGPLKSGAHRVEVMADGHVASSQNVNVVPGKQQEVKVTLDRDLSSPIWHGSFVTHPYAELVGGIALVPNLNGDAEKACDGKVSDPTGQQVPGCSSHSSSLGPLVGLRGGYEFAKGLGVELFAGYFSSGAKQTRSVTLTSADVEIRSGAYSNDYKDETKLKAPFAALSVSYRFLEKTPVTVRLWLGAARGAVTTSNAGTYSGVAGAAMMPFSVPLSIPETSQSVWIPILGPEARFGLRVSKALTVDLGAAFLWGLPGKSTRTGDTGASANGTRRYVVPTPSGRQAIVALPKEDALGTFLVIAPTLGARMDF